jgi:DNA-binding NarL/FixJ family response regulator
MNMQPGIQTVVVDDSHIVRAGLCYFLSDANDITVVGEAGDVAEALMLIEAVQPNVVVMDLLMPGSDSITGMAQVCQRFPNVRMLVLTTEQYQHTPKPWPCRQGFTFPC